MVEAEREKRGARPDEPKDSKARSAGRMLAAVFRNFAFSKIIDISVYIHYCHFILTNAEIFLLPLRAKLRSIAANVL